MKVTARILIGFLLLLTILTTSLITSTTALATGYPGKNRTALVVPTAISPTGILTDTTPTYKWSNVSGATQYRFQVFKGTTWLFTKTVLASVACGTTTCTNTPINNLGNGNFKWHVSATNGVSWTNYSAFKSFTTTNIPASFDSEFNGSMSGWNKIGTIPWYAPSTFIYPAISTSDEKCANVYRSQSIAFKNLDYSARTKCLTTDFCENYLAIRMGSKAEPEENCWFPGYIFGYDDDGYAKIGKILKNGSWMYPWSKFSTAVNKTGYNTIRVVANGTSFKFYINGTYITTYSDSDYKIGAVGVLMWEYGTTQMYVDWAKATVLP